MKTIASLLPAMTAPTTTNRSPQPLSPKFVEWLGIELFGDPELTKMAEACQQWLYAMRDGGTPRWLSLLGDSGTGKTHCASRLWRAASARFDWQDYAFGHRKIYWPQFVQDLRAGDAFGLRTELRRWPVLFLDDVGAERDPSGFAAEELNTLLGCRVGRWTLLTSNKTADALQRLDGRIFSRLIRDANVCVSIRAQDYATRPVAAGRAPAA